MGSDTLMKFTFEDGSEAIAHYGTKGMKWGHWNEETKARYASKGIGLSGGGGGAINPDHMMPSQSSTLDGDRTLDALTGKDEKVNQAVSDYKHGAQEFFHNVQQFAHDVKVAKDRAESYVIGTKERWDKFVSSGKELIDWVTGSKKEPTVVDTVGNAVNVASTAAQVTSSSKKKSLRKTHR